MSRYEMEREARTVKKEPPPLQADVHSEVHFPRLYLTLACIAWSCFRHDHWNSRNTKYSRWISSKILSTCSQESPVRLIFVSPTTHTVVI